MRAPVLAAHFENVLPRTARDQEPAEVASLTNGSCGLAAARKRARRAPIDVDAMRDRQLALEEFRARRLAG
jgi:hypothetical protein